MEEEEKKELLELLFLNSFVSLKANACHQHYYYICFCKKKRKRKSRVQLIWLKKECVEEK